MVPFHDENVKNMYITLVQSISKCFQEIISSENGTFHINCFINYLYKYLYINRKKNEKFIHSVPINLYAAVCIVKKKQKCIKSVLSLKNPFPMQLI